ncbi:MAG: dihydrofolate reductase [Candidatus Parcubacteria bacterium]|jgi:dihydrofolate reductase|nr:dihydrofolate reductase [Candidatus Parcubacteria bacterium]
MICFIIAALSADGFIAKNDRHPAFWTSKEDKKRFVDLTKRAGVVVMGAKTFATLPRPLKERVNIVYSRTKKYEGAETMDKSPEELLKELDSRGVKEVAICGGSEIYTMFMKAAVVDTLYLTIEPILFGTGIKLFNEDMLYHLKLISSMQAGNGALLLEYKVDYAGAARPAITDLRV